MIRNLLLIALLFAFFINLSFGQQFKPTSKLVEGTIYKVKVTHEGIYQIDYNFLSSIEGLDLSNLNPSHINLLTNGYGTLPERNNASRIDDLLSIPTMTFGLEDGRFNENDRIIFFAGSPDNIQILDDKVSVDRNPYDFYNYIFIHISSSNSPAELHTNDLQFDPELEVTDYLQFVHHEKELINLQDYVTGQHGSGKRWFGESFSIENKRNYSALMNAAAPLASGHEINVEFALAARAGSGADIRFRLNDLTKTYSIGKTNLSNGESPVAVPLTANERLNIDNVENLQIEFLPRSNIDEAWLDYITISYFTSSPDLGSYAIIQNPESKNNSTAFSLNSNNPNLRVWNITKAENIYGLQADLQGGKLVFLDSAHSEVQRYAVLDITKAFSTPEFESRVNNQNLHGMDAPECLVVYHPDFESEVDRWMEHRASVSGMTIKKADVGSIYNEFGGGAQDPSAIRDFARMLYEKNTSFKYLLLFGDGSFDYRYINKNNPYSNFVPVYETDNSLSPINSYPTDDFYGLLSPMEGNSIQGALEISIGRLPVNTAKEATQVVNKIITYDTDPESLGDWRLRNVFLADDEDQNKHLKDANQIAETVRQNNLFNIEKIYFDAFPQERGAGGIRIPGAKESLNNAIFKGSLVVTYLGHGGPFGMAQERVLDINQIQTWANSKKLPLFVTATCSFAPYDDPSIFSAGEIMVTKESGGSIALFTTVRPVYSISNERLTRAVHDRILENLENKELTIGEVLKLAKNSNSQDTLAPNARKFTLIGDPTLRLAIPKYKVITASINGNNAQIETDTSGPLSITHVSGYIADASGDIQTSFNGELEPTVFDKVEVRRTLGQDNTSYQFNYAIQDNALWKGKVPVINGEFEFTFVLPKSIDPEYGTGKISYYASSKSDHTDAAGAYDKLVIGGYPEDSFFQDEPPLIDLYIDNRFFNPGDKVGPNPFLYAKLSDDIGINLSTNNLGKEITAFMDGNRADPIILNSFFEPSIEDYRAGSIKYPLKDLEAGWHELEIRAWDVTDNYSEESIRFFVVRDDENPVIEFSAYPNPFETSTCFRLKADLPSGNYQAELQIMNTNGQFVENLPFEFQLEGNEVNCLKWTPNFNDQKVLYSGIYFSRLKIIRRSDNMPIYTSVHKLIYIN